MLDLKSISKKTIENCIADFSQVPGNQLLMNSIHNTGIDKVGINRQIISQTNHLFNCKVDDWEVMDQKQSGRCWIFAGMNLYKPELCKKFNVKDIKLSANFVQFWDFFEKANLFFNNVEKTASEPINNRLVTNILNCNLEGGWWDMFIAVVNKYGIVPDEVMPDTIDAAKSAKLCSILASYLRSQAKEIRAKVCNEADLEGFKQNYMSSVYRILVMHLGAPPEKFDWTYENEKKKVITLKDSTPLLFSSGLENMDCVTLINDPREERPFMKHYTSECVGTIEGCHLNFLNVDIETIKKLVIKMIDTGRPVWMSCDVNKMADHENGIFNEKLYNYSELLSIPEPMSKADRLNYCDGTGNHAMLFTGYHEVDGNVTKWRIENSWGDKKGKKGYYELSDKWFNEHVYSSLISREFLSKEHLAVLDEPFIKLMPWELPY